MKRITVSSLGELYLSFPILQKHWLFMPVSWRNYNIWRIYSGNSWFLHSFTSYDVYGESILAINDV